ncbi:MAG: hypothetical protein JSR17_06115 [Proteobacteria bacterium]|nr:hypothetical protein [Pseudomonadota bacterium]
MTKAWLKENKHYLFYGFIVVLTLSRVLGSRILACLPDFDCNAYIQMANTITYDSTILPHHAMRLLPALMAHGLMLLGLSTELAFRILSDSTYVLFGCLTFWVLKQFRVNSLLALATTLLCLAPHHAMRIPLQNVYQLCDMMTYPISLMLVYFSLKEKGKWVFALSIVALLTKQTVFGLGGLSLLYCFYKTRRIENLIYAVILGLSYLGLSQYYHAFSIVGHHLIPNSDFFTLSNIGWIIQDSKIIELFIPIIPFMIIYFKEIAQFLVRYWHIAGYMAVVMGQPFIAYHLTGNNFARLALQGAWIVYLIIGLSLGARWQQDKKFQALFLIYSLAVFFTWSVHSRLIYMLSFIALWLIYYKTSSSKACALTIFSKSSPNAS